jgi:PAS domain S-box-containing protein
MGSRKCVSGVLIGLSVLVVIASGLYAWEQHGDMQRQMQRAELFKGMITAPDYGLDILNPNGDIVEWGEGAEKLFGWQAREVLYRNPLFLMPVIAGRVESKAIDVARDSGAPLREVNCWANRKDGQLIPVHFVAAAFKDTQGCYHATIFVAGHVDRPIVIPRDVGDNQVSDLNTMVGWTDE